jgi:hypothetical protein
VRAEWFRQSGQAQSDLWVEYRWPKTPHLVSILCVLLHIALLLPFSCFCSLCKFTILKPSLWCCSQLWPSVRKGWLGTHLNRHCNAIGDDANICPHVPSTLSLRTIARWWRDMILPGLEDKQNCVDPQNLWKSEWNQELGKEACVVLLYDKMRWKWEAVYPALDRPNIYSVSLIQPPSPLLSIHRVLLLSDIIGGRDRSSLGMHWVTVIEPVWRCTWRPRWSELRDALQGPDRLNSEMYSDAVTKRVLRCTWRVWSSDIAALLGGGQFGGSCDAHCDSIHGLTCNCGNVHCWMQHPPRDEKLAGSRRMSIMGWCYTWCMLYSVLTDDYGMEW